MQQFLIAAPPTLIVLGFMILIHELGHHLVAKFFGVRVDVFSIGFGKRLFGVRYGDTDYRVSALPFGGYVKVAGMDAVESKVEFRSNDPGEFMNNPRWQRVLIAVAGPAVNIIFAVILLTGIYTQRYPNPAYMDQPAKIGGILHGSEAEKIGLKKGDLVVRADNQQNPNWQDLVMKAGLNMNRAMSIAVQRDSQLLTFQVTPQPSPKDNSGFGVEPVTRLLIQTADPAMPGYKAGLRPGDELLSLNGKPIESGNDIKDHFRQNGPQAIAIGVKRGAATLSFTVTPKNVSEGDAAPVYL